MKRYLILLSQLLAMSSQAGIESSRALQFFTLEDGIALPENVPAAAYYDSYNPSGKELRVTTNVASSVYSLISGLLERYGIINSRFDQWQSQTISNTAQYFAKCKDSTLSVRPEALYAYSFPSNRRISSLRITPRELLANARNDLRNLADNPYYGYEQYIRTSSSFLIDTPYSMFPDFDWTSNQVSSIRTEEQWAETLPSFSSAAADGLWKTRDYYDWDSNGRNFSATVLEFFEDFEWNYLPSESLTNSLNIGCLESKQKLPDQILKPIFADKTAQFTNDTSRLNYYTLGILQQAVRSIDLSYAIGCFSGYMYQVEDLDHSHLRNSYLRPPISVDITSADGAYTAKVGSFSGSWTREETFETITNSAQSIDYPRHACYGDTILAGGVISVQSAPITLSFDEIINILNIFPGKTCSIYFTPLSWSIQNGSIHAILRGEGVMHEDTITIESPASFEVLATANINREIRTTQTLSRLDTNNLACANYPGFVAFQTDMVKNIDLQAHENRLLAKNCNIWVDDEGFLNWRLGTGVVAHASQRSKNVISCNSKSKLEEAWGNRFFAHNSAVESLSPYPLKPIASLIPIPIDSLRDVESEVGKGGNVQLTWNIRQHVSSCDINIVDESTLYILSRDKDGALLKISYLNVGEELIIGSIGGTTNITVATSMTPRPPFIAEGKSRSLQRVKWRFNSLHPTDQ